MEGLRSARLGQETQAVDRFQSAVSAERGNPVYQRALAEAMLDAGKVEQAQSVANDRLQHDPTDAAASLLVGRALVREGRPREAVSYYHRAIYGQWDSDSTGNRVRARFELVDLLARLGAQRDLLAELLPLQDEAPGDLATRRRIAHLFLDAGAPTRAIEIYRDLLRSGEKDGETYAGLGEAELARGNYRSAQSAFNQAVQLAPGDSAIRGRLGLTQRVIALDPTQRGLTPDERYRRSVELLGGALQLADSCFGADSSLAHHAVLDSARAAIGTRPARGGDLRGRVDADLDLAERLWDLRREQCPAKTGAAEEPVALVLERMTQ
jgi:tetratricopeptide (TPR) repeat protein